MRVEVFGELKTRGKQSGGERVQSILPECPHVSPFPPARIPLVLAPIALTGLAVSLYFTITVGIGVLLFLLAATSIGALYVFAPFRYAFLYTAFIPPLISGGIYLALADRPEGMAFAVSVPITLISLAGLAVVAPIPISTWMFAMMNRVEQDDSVPATALGVMMHTSTSLVIAVSLWLG